MDSTVACSGAFARGPVTSPSVRARPSAEALSSPGAPGILSALFLAHCGVASPVRQIAGLEEELAARVGAGRAAWPGVEIEPQAFVRHVAERASEGLPPSTLAGDLYLACACASGVPAALEAFQRTFREDVRRAVAKTDSSPAFHDEVMQLLSMKLFLRTGDKAPAIGEYSGRASLRGWVVTVARRTALNMKRNRADQAHDEMTSGVRQLGAVVGPEIALLKARYKAEFEASIRAGMASLSEKERSLLLLHLVEGVTLPDLAAMQNVSRATVARWLVSARESLFAATREALQARLRLSPSEYESVLALVRSQLEVSVAQVLR